MTSRALKTEADLDGWINALRSQPLPLTVSFVRGAKRSNPQNRTFNKWYAEIAAQLDDLSPAEVRAQCKLMHGVPILRRDDAAFRLTYDASFKPLAYETKLNLFVALEPAVTSKMTVKQVSEYMGEMQRHYLPMGIQLTDPDAQKYQQECL